MRELVQDTEWQGKALELRATGLGTSEIGDAVGKHPATIRKLFARNPAEDRVLSSEEASEAFSAPEEPQTTVYDHLPSEEPAPEDDPEYEPEERHHEFDVSAEEAGIRITNTEFRAEAGEPVGPMQTRPGEEPPTEREMDGGEEVVSAPQIKGTAQLALDFGPDAAMVTSASIVFKSEKLTSGYFEMGDVISGHFTARITAITGAEKFDKDLDSFVAKPQAQTATITEIEVF